ncbi:MAG: hypothetical protein NT116_03565, partial [Candidatus Parcubacteria bacterium]|nr:hypothetical protein [Candidatus Parcubacteria bacterium]
MRIIFITIRNFLVYFRDFRELFLEKLIRVTIYGGALLLPLFFIPFGVQFLEYSKVIFFYGLVILALIFWSIKIYFSKKINWQAQSLDVPVILLLFVYFLASLFSVDRQQSFLGANLAITESFVTVLFLVLFFFITSRFIKSIKEVVIIFSCLLTSSFLAVLNYILNLFSLNIFSFFLGNAVNSFYFLILLGLILGTVCFIILKNKKIRILPLILSFLFLVALYFIHNQNILLLLILSIFIFLLISSFRSLFFSNKLVVILTVSLFLSVIVLILPISRWIGPVSPTEFNLPTQFGWQINKASLADNLLLGAGPQNFSISFYKYKPLSFNQTDLWNLGFAKNSNFWLENLNNLGILGLLILLIIIIKYWQKSLSFIRRFEVLENFALEKFIIVVIITTIITSIFIFGFFSNFDLPLYYLLFLFLALGSSLIEPIVPDKIITNKYLINLISYLIIILILCFLYYGVKFAAAEIYVGQALGKTYSAIDDFNWGEKKLKQAIKDNPSRVDYSIKLLSLRINKFVFFQKNSQTADLENLLKQIAGDLDSLDKRSDLRLADYLILQNDYAVLKNLGYSLADQQQQIIEKLLVLDPNNPELYIDRALLNFDRYLLLKQGKIQVADQANQIISLFKQVKADIDKSIELKSNFILGYYNLGLYYLELGDQGQAQANIEKAYNLDPSQKLVVLSLKKLYLNQDKADKAREILNKYLEYYPQ